MDGITQMVRGLVETYKSAPAGTALSNSQRETIGSCPRCGRPVYEGKKSFYCSGYKDNPSCGFALWKNDRFFTGKRKELTKKIAASLLNRARGCHRPVFREEGRFL